MADFSRALEASASYGFFHYLRNGHVCVGADATGNGVEKVYGKDISCNGADVTAGGDGTHMLVSFFIETCRIWCGTTTLQIKDGSDGTSMFGLLGGDSTVGVSGEFWFDFRDDGGLACLTADNTKSLCISANNGHWDILLTGYWG